MSIERRILTQVMLRGCKYRVISNSKNDTVCVPIPIRLTAIRHSKGDQIQAETLARETLVISKLCAQAYLDLYAQVTELAAECKGLADLTRKLDRASFQEAASIMNSVGVRAWALDNKLCRFLDDEMIADRKDWAV
jgi:hypothetical protein